MPKVVSSKALPPRSQAGGITIMIALSLLVFLTLAAVGMSRNTLREAVLSGTQVQGSMARNVADSGIEWAVFWMTPSNEPSGSGSAQQFAGSTGLIQYLSQNPNLAGVPYALNQTVYTGIGSQSLPADLTVQGSSAGTTSGFTVSVTLMGGGDMLNTTNNPGAGQYNPGGPSANAMAPRVYAVRSDGLVTQGGVTFTQSKEAWISMPIQ